MSRIAALLVWSISGDKQLTEELLVKLWTQCFLSGSQRDLLGSQDAREWVLNAAPSLFSKAESQLTSAAEDRQHRAMASRTTDTAGRRHRAAAALARVPRAH